MDYEAIVNSDLQKNQMIESNHYEFHESETRRLFSQIGFSYILYLIASAIAQIVTIILFVIGEHMGFFRSMQSGLGDILVLSSLVTYAIAFPVFLLINRQIPISGKIRKRKWGIDKLAVCIVICLCVSYIGQYMGIAVMKVINLYTGKIKPDHLQIYINQLSMFQLLLLVVIFAPITEELMFRKILIDRIAIYGQNVCIVVSGILFGLFHGNFYQFFYACGLGMIFAYVYVKTGNIKYSIVLHMVINFLGGFVAVYVNDLAQRLNLDKQTLQFGFNVWRVGFIIAGMILLCYYRKQIKLESGIVTIPKKKRFSTIALNAGMILLGIRCGIMFLFSLLNLPGL